MGTFLQHGLFLMICQGKCVTVLTCNVTHSETFRPSSNRSISEEISVSDMINKITIIGINRAEAY